MEPIRLIEILGPFVAAFLWPEWLNGFSKQRMWTTSIKIDIDSRGHRIPDDQSEIVERLRSQAFAVQKHFDLAEHSALILAESLGDEESSVASAVNDTYEAHAFKILQTQLYRLLIVDLFAGVLDNNPRTGSVWAILKELKRDTTALDAIRAYYTDPTCLHVTVVGEGIDADFLEKQKVRAVKQSVQDSLQSINDQWARIEKDSSILNTDAAKWMLWARHKTTAHIERTETGIVALEDEPPHGEGKLTRDEPIKFLAAVRPFVYDVYSLITANNWSDDHTNISRFYAKAFWDRFKNGNTDLEP